MPRVSICIPTYNNADEVEHLLQTIYEQDYTDYEINISDDSDNNETADIVSKYQKMYSQVTLNYKHNEKNLGHILNWNAAIDMATGEYIKIMFSDDWFTDSKSLGKFVEMLDRNTMASIAFSGSRQVMFGDEVVEHITSEHNVSSYDRYASDEFIENLKKDYRYLFCGNQIGAPSATIYRRGNNLALFDENSNWASDMFLYFELLREGANFEYTKEPLISIGVHANQYTESFSEKDERIYNDYRYMYTKYQLNGYKPCQEYFTEKFIIRYKKGQEESGKLGISVDIYWNKWIKNKMETLTCFIKNRIKRQN